MIVMTADELMRYFDAARAASGHQGPPCIVERLDDRQLHLRFELGQESTRPGGSVTGPTLFGMIDSIGWLMAVAHSGPGTDAFTTDVTVQYLRPVHPGPVRLEATVLKRGRRHVFEVAVDPDENGPAVHAVIAFATRASNVLPGRDS